ncbi:MBL fold metallo-hydrolase [Texcoconibacillus texcoconensis]|uniref:Glyoxylase-like metal-dependent hydrolase (Beta-lactamase superfamily II) n=1 Tax=Texcoconibacillus texcoconensis TaxID=1095777 RepID=A0A840QP11_9BACI|nr:MBL fold metallo-hydrolase [Texcoconibacillus texcoconensis]MBB5173115.1 glyoxylase-like metal-dependent hydrolase (beta-lactamase superfamily II) [Texcoconibacillus texcoconensis]
MKWERQPLGALQTNSFICVNDQGKGVVIDPGGEGDRLIKHINDRGIDVEGILLTHAHFDHIGALEEVRDAFRAPVYLHELEAAWLGDDSKNGSGLFMGIEPVKCRPADQLIKEEGSLTVGSFTFEVFHTPGHSPGSVSYYVPEENVVFSGDVLFRGGIGRTDLPGGDHDTLMKTIHQRLLTMPDTTIIANGHGPETTVGEEMTSNPFLNGFG